MMAVTLLVLASRSTQSICQAHTQGDLELHDVATNGLYCFHACIIVFVPAYLFPCLPNYFRACLIVASVARFAASHSPRIRLRPKFP